MFTDTSFTDFAFDGEPLDWRVQTDLETQCPSNVVPVAGKPAPKKKTRKNKKQSDTNPKPKRMLNAYNYFFHHHRQLILDETPQCEESERPRNGHGKIQFAELAREISARWKKATPEEKAYFYGLMAQDKERNAKEMKIWKEKEELRKNEFSESRGATHSFDETRMMDKGALQRLAHALGDDCDFFIRAFR